SRLRLGEAHSLDRKEDRSNQKSLPGHVPRTHGRAARGSIRGTWVAMTAKPTTQEKALRINVDTAKYGTFAEIGAGQEVARWFFRVGGAAGTVGEDDLGIQHRRE